MQATRRTRPSLTLIVLVAAAVSAIPFAPGVANADDSAAPAAPVVAPPASGAAASVHSEHVDVELVAETTSLSAGADAVVGLRFSTTKDWHIYWKNSGDSGMTPTARWRLPAGFEAGPIDWPAPTRFATATLGLYGYTGEIVLPVTLRVPAGAAGDSATLAVDVEWLVCDEECVPGDAALSITLPLRGEPPAPDARTAPLFAAARRLLPQAPGKGVRVSAYAMSEAVRLSVKGEGPWNDVASRLTWFPDAGNLFLARAKYEPLRKSDEQDSVSIDLPIDRPGPGRRPPSRLVGVLDVERGGERTPLAIDVEVSGAPASDAQVAAPLAAASGTGRTAGTASPAPPPDDDEPKSLWDAILLAFLGGIVLNVMPCVLPVLSVKILGFVQQAGEDPRRVRRHGYAFGVGVLASFWALAGLLLALRAAGAGLGWGFQFQEPAFVAGLALLMFASGLNLLSVFEFGHGLAGAAGTAAHRLGTASYTGSFGNGVLATVVATPCTAPFMGVAVGWALSAPTAASLAVFTALGLGMAAPYVLLSVFPAWLHRLPKPGPWMETFKHVMAFPMFAVAIWMLPAFGKQVGVFGLTLLLLAFLLVGFGAWLFGRFGVAWRGPVVRTVVGRGLAAVFLVAGLGVAWNAAHRDAAADAAPPEGWIAWRPGLETKLRAEGRVVLLDFTADWCPTCKANDKLVLSTDEVEAAARRLNVARVQADWTVKSREIREALASFGRESVPLYVVFSPDRSRPPEKLPTVITPAAVVAAFERAAAPSAPAVSPDVHR